MRHNEQAGIVRSYASGLVNLLTFINLHNGRGSLGDRLMDKCMPKIARTIPYITGMLSALAIELTLPLYLINEQQVDWKYVLLGDLAIKTIPRLGERIYNSYRKSSE